MEHSHINRFHHRWLDNKLDKITNQLESCSAWLVAGSARNSLFDICIQACTQSPAARSTSSRHLHILHDDVHVFNLAMAMAPVSLLRRSGSVCAIHGSVLGMEC